MVQNPPANIGDSRGKGLISGSGRSSGVGNGNPVQYSCLENARDRKTRQATVYGVTKESDVTDPTCTYPRVYFFPPNLQGFVPEGLISFPKLISFPNQYSSRGGAQGFSAKPALICLNPPQR